MSDCQPDEDIGSKRLHTLLEADNFSSAPAGCKPKRMLLNALIFQRKPKIRIFVCGLLMLKYWGQIQDLKKKYSAQQNFMLPLVCTPYVTIHTTWSLELPPPYGSIAKLQDILWRGNRSLLLRYPKVKEPLLHPLTWKRVVWGAYVRPKKRKKGWLESAKLCQCSSFEQDWPRLHDRN